MRHEYVELSLQPTTVYDIPIKRKPQKIPKWQPTCLRPMYFSIAVGSIIVHAMWSTTLIILKYTKNDIFTFPVSNGGAPIFWQLIPILTAVISGISWEVIYIAACRFQPYRDLASRQGSTLKNSLSQNYLTTFSWFVPYHAYYHPNKHTALAYLSVTYLMSYGILPVLSAAMIKVEWNDDITEGTARCLVYLVALDLVVSMLAISFAVMGFLCLRRQRSGLYTDPAGLAGLGTLIAASNLVDKLREVPSLATQDMIDKALGHLQLGLRHTGSAYQIILLDESQTVPNLSKRKWRRSRNEAHPLWLRGTTYFFLNLVLIIPFFTLLYIGRSMVAEHLRSGSNVQYVGTRSFLTKVCTVVVALMNAACYSTWHLNIATMEPFYALAKSSTQGTKPNKKTILTGSSDAIRMNFTGSAIANLLRPIQVPAVWLMAVCAFMTQLAIIVRCLTDQNTEFITILTLKEAVDKILRQYGMTDPYHWPNIPAGIPSLRVISYTFIGIYLFFGLGGLVLILSRRRKPILPRKPHTLSSQILYLCHSTALLKDFEGLSTLSKKTREVRLIQNGHRYALGWLQSDVTDSSCVGIEVIENVERRFRFPKADEHGNARPKDSSTGVEKSPDITLREAGWPENAR